MKTITKILIFALVFTLSFTANAQQVGDIDEGGYIFQINEDGTGLVADLQDFGPMSWYDAIDFATNATSQGYNDWYLPTIEELYLMYYTIGQGAVNTGGFTTTTTTGEPLIYLSSTFTDSTNSSVKALNFPSSDYIESNFRDSIYGNIEVSVTANTSFVRLVRSVTFGVSDCTDSTAYNYNYLATEEDGSCIYSDMLYGCMNPSSDNYDSMATLDDGSCIYSDDSLGCMEEWADNYNSNATSQLPDEIIPTILDFTELLIPKEGEQSELIYSSNNSIYINAFEASSINNNISSCLEGGDFYMCFPAYQELQYQSIDSILMSYSLEVQNCFQNSDVYACENALMNSYEEMHEYLNTLDADTGLINSCLQGDGLACISADSDISEYPIEIQNCFLNGNDCDIAIDLYYAEMVSYFNYDSSHQTSVSESLLLPQDGDYSFNFNYLMSDEQQFDNQNSEVQIYYALNEDTTFLNVNNPTEYLTFTANAGDTLSFGIRGNHLGEIEVSVLTFYTNLGSPSCQKVGCMSMWADNFDELATIDNYSCSKLGCTSYWADNYDIFANIDDDSCERIGCTLDWADNFDLQATTDNNSCYRYGCVSDWAENYDELATIDSTSSIDLTSISTSVYPNNSNGYVNINSNSFVIYGINSDDDLPNGTSQSLTIPIYKTGTYTFNWQHTDYDMDGAFYAVNFDPTSLIEFYNSSEVIFLAQNGSGQFQDSVEVWNGTEELFLNAGDQITFGVFGEDLCCGIGVLTVEDLALLDNGDGSCYKNGCTDSLACNYDSIATNDNGSCGMILTLTSSQPEYYCSDFSWDLSDNENLAIAEGLCDESLEVCISEGDYTLSSYNSVDSEWWPSWTYVLIDEMDSATTFNNSGSYTEDSLTLYFTVEFGCIDDHAKNFSTSATLDDGSCYYGSCMDPIACNYDETANEDDGSCIYSDNICQVCELVHNHYELIEDDDDLDGICNDDDIAGCTNELSCNYDPFATDDDDSCIAADACVDCALAIIGVYLTNDSDNDGTCDDNEVDGCTDNVACNFNPSATENDDSCTYSDEGLDCEDNCISETALPLIFGGGAWISEAYFDIIDCSNNSILSGGGEEINKTCIELPDNYTIYLVDKYGDGWNGNQLQIGDSIYQLPEGASDTIDYSCIIPGCIDILACNYDSLATVDDGSCTFPIENYDCDFVPLDLNNNGINDMQEETGCISDDTACNYSTGPATLNDFSLCEYPLLGFNCAGTCLSGIVYKLKMMDSFGDGWNGNSITIGDVDYSFDSGSEAIEDICINPLNCYQILFSIGSYATEVSWSLLDQNDLPIIDNAESPNILEDQGAFFSAELGQNYQGVIFNGMFGDCDTVPGCMNPIAINYNEVADLDNGSCIFAIYGCMNPEADNFNQNSNVSDESCEFSGCSIQFATNYNPIVTIDDGSCIIAIYGCMNPEADNYNPFANTDDASCITTGFCANETLIVYLNDNYGDGWNGNILSVGSYSLTLEHNSESFNTYFGTDTICVDMNYCNTITVNGGTWANEVSWSIETLNHTQIITGNAPFIGTFGYCEIDVNDVTIIDGCMETIANNYDPYATIQELAECLYSSNYDVTEEVGCNDILAINYNPGAQEFSSGSCIYYGCTSPDALNYNQMATVDDGSCFSEGCNPGYITDCETYGDCYPASWLGDNYADCGDEEWGADFSCYQNDGGDCGGFDPAWNDDPITITNWDLWCANELSQDCYVCEIDYVANNCSFECSASGCDYGSSLGYILGCTDSLSANYNPSATINDGSCGQGIHGCTTETACNYNESAVIDDSSCIYALDGMDCDEVVNYEFTQSNIFSNQPYVLKEGICNLDSYFLVADEYYMKGVNYGDVTSEDGMYFEFEHVSSISEELPILFGDTVYIKINNLYVSSNLNHVSLTAEINKAIKVVVTPKIDPYIGLPVTSFDKFNIVGLFDNSTTQKYLERRESDNLYSWTEDYSFGSFKASNYLDYSEINCGCTNPLALNFDISATENNNSCAIEGCMDPYNVLFDPIANVPGSCDSLIEGCVYDWAFNYNPSANVDNTSCITFEYGCIDTLYLDFDPLANTDDGSCLNLIVEGCTDSLYLDYWLYNQTTLSITLPFMVANIENGSCADLILFGCADFAYLEYNDSTNVEDHLMCETLKLFGCTDSLYTEFDPLSNTEDGTCDVQKIFGCTNNLYLDFNQLANTDDGSCLILIVTGCMDVDFTEYNSTFTVPDTSCFTPVVFGCTDPMFVEFSVSANTDNGSCANYLVTGCGNPSALNYVLGVTNNDNSLCIFEETYGCTNFISLNYNAFADINDGSCIDVIMGCMYDLAFNFNPIANTDNGSCILVYTGCLDSTMFNYNANVNTDDGSCYPIIEGCTDQLMLNYVALANTDDNSCISVYQGCTDSTMLNFDVEANFNNGSCIPIVQGCINALYLEYNPEANSNNESCAVLISEGCTNELYIQYDELANTNDGSCLELIIYGCTNELYIEFNDIANVDDGICYELLLEGCTNQLMYNYNGLANIDDGSCYMLIEGCSDPSYFEFDSNVNSDNGTCIELIVLGCMDDGFIEYNIEANLDDDSCSDIVIPGCTNTLYLEYDTSANINNGSCQVLVILGCMDASMYNYYESANTDDGSCFSLSNFTLNPLDYQFNMSITAQIEQTSGVFSTNLNDSIILISSVTNEISGFATLELVPFGDNNYYAFITAYSNNLSDNLIVYVASSAIEAGFQIVDTLEFIPNSMLGSISTPWIFSLISSDENYGCTNENAVNYNSNASINNGTCIILGCINSDYVEYNFEANLDDGSCSLTWQGAYESLSNSVSENNDVANQLLIDSLQLQLDSLLVNSNSIQTSLVDFFLEFPEGWSLFGFNCYESVNVELAFIDISDKVILLKDEFGSSYIPEYNFNGIGNLNYSEGYQIKLSEVVTNFQFCKILISEEE